MSNDNVYIDRTHTTTYKAAKMPSQSPAASPLLSPGLLTPVPRKTPAREPGATQLTEPQLAYTLTAENLETLEHSDWKVTPARVDTVIPYAQQWCALDSVQKQRLSPSCYQELERMLPTLPAGFNTDVAIHSAEMAVTELTAHTLPSTTCFVSVSTTADSELCLRSVSGRLSIRNVLPVGLFRNYCMGRTLGNVVDTVAAVENTLDSCNVDKMTSLALLDALVQLEKLSGEWAVENMHVEAYVLNVDLPRYLTQDSHSLSTSEEALQYILKNNAAGTEQQKAALAALPFVAMHLRKWVQCCNSVLTKSGVLFLQTRPLTSQDIATRACKTVQSFSTTLRSLCKLARVLETTYPPELRHVNLTDYTTIEDMYRGKVIAQVDALVSTQERILSFLREWPVQANIMTVSQDVSAFSQVQRVRKMSIDPELYMTMHAHKHVGEWDSVTHIFTKCAFSVAACDDYVGPGGDEDRFAFAFELGAMTRLDIGEPTDVTLVPTTSLHDSTATVVRRFNVCVCNDADVVRVPGGRIQLHNKPAIE